MNRLIQALLLLSPAAGSIDILPKRPGKSINVAMGHDTAPISLDDIESRKAGRLLKNKQDIEVQSNYHENDIRDTGAIADDKSGRIVRNRGPITAKIVASGHHERYCEKGQVEGCGVDFSLVAWKFAGDSGTVHGSIEEKFENGEMLKVGIDCLVRTDKEAIVGGWVKQIPKHFDDLTLKKRAYVKVKENSETTDTVDFISNVVIGSKKELDVESGCSSVGAEDFQSGEEFNCVSPRVSVCSKHGDWEDCLERATTE